MSDFINLWLHLLGLAAYFGATLAVLLMVLPPAMAQPDPAVRRRQLAAALQVYNPLVIAALGVALMTGAFNLTSYKAALRGAFFTELGSLLVWKLGLAFVLIMLATYGAFGLGHRLVRFEQWGEPVEADKEAAMIRRLRATLLLALVLTAMITALGLRLAPRGLPTPPPVQPKQTSA
ncbi:MAG: hypothetical protein HY699_04700 [Deltaproteobacteria bacterium]|nr:hypothetical protein [Deltaproteobacteria bacterium]